MEDAQSILQIAKEEQALMIAKRDMKELSNVLSDPAPVRLIAALQTAYSRIQELETENQRLSLAAAVATVPTNGSSAHVLLSDLEKLREALVHERSERQELEAEVDRLNKANCELERQVNQLSPTKTLAKRIKTALVTPRAGCTADDSIRSYKSLYQKRRMQSMQGEFNDISPRFSYVRSPVLLISVL